MPGAHSCAMADVAGLELARRFYVSVVEPIIRSAWPDLAYSAALLGPGSEVLGFDDAMSRDHHWGPRVQLFLTPVAVAEKAVAIEDHLSRSLPYTFMGYSTNFSPPDPLDNGTQLLADIDTGPIRHRIEIASIEDFLIRYIGVSSLDSLAPHDWLTLPEQKLRSLVSGGVFHDGLPAGDNVAELRRRLSYYPRDVWLFQMAAVWQRIGQEEHLAGRAGYAGDEVGSAVIASRLARDIMRLCFLIERTYAPYAKWLGTAFRRLGCGPRLYPLLKQVVTAKDWRAREAPLVCAYEEVATMHNALGVTRAMPQRARRFFGRPFSVIAIEGFAGALLDAIGPSFMTDVMRRSPIGGIDQISDNTDVLEDPAFRPILRALYG